MRTYAAQLLETQVCEVLKWQGGKEADLDRINEADTSEDAGLRGTVLHETVSGPNRVESRSFLRSSAFLAIPFTPLRQQNKVSSNKGLHHPFLCPSQYIMPYSLCYFLFQQMDFGFSAYKSKLPDFKRK
jgi:hypothetical protein